MLRVNGTEFRPERFPDGTQRLRLDPAPGTATEIEWRYERDEEMVTILYLVGHLRERDPARAVSLVMPYIPNARMDRVKEPDEVFTLKYFCAFVNSLRFDSVRVRDAHSSVSLALLDRVVSEDVHAPIRALAGRLLTGERDIVFFPDEGSSKRYALAVGRAAAFGVKRRDWRTGRIDGLEVSGDVPEAPFNALIVDDISSYGGTFLHAARRLKELGADTIWLYVTHCENSVLEGELIRSGLVAGIFTTASIYTGDHPLVEVLDRKE